MIVLRYNDTIVSLPHEWKDITIAQATKVAELALPKIDDDFDWYAHSEYINKVLNILCKIEVEKVSPISLNYIFTKYIVKFCLDLNAPLPTSYVPEMITYFKHKGIVYLMPTNLNIDETVILQHGQTVKNFIEASNLLKAFSRMRSEGIRAFPYLIASTVKRERLEVFDEVEVSKRAGEFQDLPMSIAWEVFFCLSLLTVKFVSVTRQSMKANRMERLKEKLIIVLGRLRLQRAELLANLRR